MAPIHQEKKAHDLFGRSKLCFRYKEGYSGLEICEAVDHLPVPLTHPPKNVKNRTFGLLMHYNEEDNERVPLKATFSGHNFTIDPAYSHKILANEKWRHVVSRFAGVIQLGNLRSIRDGAGQKRTADREGYWETSHVEKKLATLAISIVLTLNGFKGPLTSVKLADIFALRGVRWRNDKAPRFEIHISDEPCAKCLRMVLLLSRISGVSIQLMTTGVVGVSRDEPGRKITPDTAAPPNYQREKAEPVEVLDKELQRMLDDIHSRLPTYALQRDRDDDNQPSENEQYPAVATNVILASDTGNQNRRSPSRHPDEPMDSIEDSAQTSPSPSPIPLSRVQEFGAMLRPLLYNGKTDAQGPRTHRAPTQIQLMNNEKQMGPRNPYNRAKSPPYPVYTPPPYLTMYQRWRKHRQHRTSSLQRSKTGSRVLEHSVKASKERQMRNREGRGTRVAEVVTSDFFEGQEGVPGCVKCLFDDGRDDELYV